MDEIACAEKYAEAEERARNKLREIANDLADKYNNALYELADKIKACTKGVERFTFSVYGMFLTPKQKHLMIYGKKRVRKKWFNTAKKKLSKILS